MHFFYQREATWSGISASIAMRDPTSTTDHSFYLGGNHDTIEGGREIFLSISKINGDGVFEDKIWHLQAACTHYCDTAPGGYHYFNSNKHASYIDHLYYHN